MNNIDFDSVGCRPSHLGNSLAGAASFAFLQRLFNLNSKVFFNANFLALHS
jgi:hypothetical protein